MLNRLKTLFAVVSIILGFASCDTNTQMIGTSIINDMDHLEVSTATYSLTTRSIITDAVAARNTMSYLGTVKDPETGEYITANYMTQFHTLEDYEFPSKDLILSRNSDDEIIADSCELRLYREGFYGDSLTAMKLTAYEMDKPMRADQVYYSDFDPKSAGLVRDGGLKISHSYTLADLNVSDSVRALDTYSPNIRITLDGPYTDKNGKTYNNYGSYIINKYYEDPTLFKNSIRLTNNVIPGMYIESTGGLGSMAYISVSVLNVYFQYKNADSDSILTGRTAFSGTQEVMQYTHYNTDNDKLASLVNNKECTYLKTPAGIFTEVTFPVDEIMSGHENDTINQAKFALQRLLNTTDSKYAFDPASTVLLIPEDSLNTFFENYDLPDYKTSYLTTFDDSEGTYTFNNISSLIKNMQLAKQSGHASDNWNKAVVIPVTTSTDSSSNIVKVSHDMSLTSVKLVGGDDNPNGPITISIIYSKYK